MQTTARPFPGLTRPSQRPLPLGNSPSTSAGSKLDDSRASLTLPATHNQRRTAAAAASTDKDTAAGTTGVEVDVSHQEEDATKIGAVVAVAGIILLCTGGYMFKDQVSGFLDFFIGAVEEWGPLGFVAYGVVYAVLEVLALPAIPLTMTAGAIFGVGPGLLVVSVAGTAAATIAFLIARYVARDKVLKMAEDNPKFAAVDAALGKDGLKVVTLLRLSPLLPLAASNYLYGLTSVDLGSYVLGSWVGMLPGTWAYVSAGSISKQALQEGGELPLEWWQLGLVVFISALTLSYIGKVAKDALDDVETSTKPE